MAKSFFLAAVLALSGSLLFTGPAWAAHSVSGGSANTGNDVSYPQCNKSLPSSHAFGIVGVNDGIANTSNPCFASELKWALSSTVTTSQPAASLYVNTANPGNLGVADWPSNNIDPVTMMGSPDPYGTCNGADNTACAWQYGWNMADRDAQTRGVPSPQQYVWWLDVETGNSWESTTANNDADLEGMVAYFTHLHVLAVGVYSTSYQWGKIAGTPATESSLIGLPDWIPGARTLSAAQSNCGLAPLTTGAKVTITQWVQKGSSIDSDYACP